MPETTGVRVVHRDGEIAYEATYEHARSFHVDDSGRLYLEGVDDDMASFDVAVYASGAWTAADLVHEAPTPEPPAVGSKFNPIRIELPAEQYTHATLWNAAGSGSTGDDAMGEYRDARHAVTAAEEVLAAAKRRAARATAAVNAS